MNYRRQESTADSIWGATSAYALVGFTGIHVTPAVAWVSAGIAVLSLAWGYYAFIKGGCR